MSRVPGHGLRSEGAPWMWTEDGRLTRVNHSGFYGVGGLGRGVCECGESSAILDSAQKRRAWHKAHKVEVSK